jgi:predicted  nucleic acid-binding Zn-ribbon protein
MKIVREQGVGNMIGKSKPRSRNLYDEVVQLRARCEEYEEEIAALEDEVEELKREYNELQKDIVRVQVGVTL